MIKHMLLGLVFFSTSGFSYPRVPDQQQTTGKLCTVNSEDFLEYRYEEEIPYCERNVSWVTRNQIYDSYHIPQTDRAKYTIDHLIPLSIGGSNEKANLWPEHHAVKSTRQNTELELFEKINAGMVTQKEAVDFILKCKSALGTCDVGSLATH